MLKMFEKCIVEGREKSRKVDECCGRWNTVEQQNRGCEGHRGSEKVEEAEKKLD
jgi:hypothetical protein